MRLRESDARRLLLSPPSGDFIQALRAVIKDFREGGWLSITQTAKLADMSVRALQRKLAAEGHVFSKLVDEVRADLAAEMLEDRDLTLAEIATALGYSAPSNFTRAFERWTGRSPTEFRRGL